MNRFTKTHKMQYICNRNGDNCSYQKCQLNYFRIRIWMHMRIMLTQNLISVPLRAQFLLAPLYFHLGNKTDFQIELNSSSKITTSNKRGARWTTHIQVQILKETDRICPFVHYWILYIFFLLKILKLINWRKNLVNQHSL